MRHLLNSLYVLSENAWLSLENENVVVNQEDGTKRRFPLHMLEQILCFSYKGASPALMGACAERNISLCFYRPGGRFLARVAGRQYGNVLLRREQYRMADDPEKSCSLARCFIVGKIYNSRGLLERACRDHPLSVDSALMKDASRRMLAIARRARCCTASETLLGLEGEAASLYFGLFDQLILQNKSCFRFEGREKRPPRDPVNALLSFACSLLANDCASVLESTGLDPYVGFLHRDRPGRASLALDMMEELRSVFADRLVLTLINNRVVNKSSFSVQENGAVLLNDKARRDLLSAWQEKKKETIMHPFLEEKIPWGLVPFVQAQLLSRTVRGDLDQYPAFMWK